MRALLLFVLGLSACNADGIDVLTPIDAGSDTDLSPRSLCSVANVAFCDDFEGSLLAAPWDQVQLGASARLDHTRAYRGVAALHLTTNAEPATANKVRQAELTENAVVPQPGFYLRLYVYVPGPGPVAPWRLASLLQADNPFLGPQLFVDDGALVYASPTSPTLTSSQHLPVDRWVCLEWLVRSDTAGESQVWIDGTEISDLHLTGNTQPDPPVGRVSIGAAFFGAPPVLPVYDFWIDEVILHSTRVGCDR